MSNFCELETKIVCPNCHMNISPPGGVIRFQWGEVPRYYHVADKIKWLKNRKGEIIPPFQFVKKPRIFGGEQLSWNCGMPQYTDLLALESDPNITNYQCPVCSISFETLAVKIIEGRIIEGLAFTVGGMQQLTGLSPDIAAVVIINFDGSYLPKTEWNDPPFSTYSGLK